MRDLNARVRSQLEALFRADIRSLYRLVRRNLARTREPLALHKGKVQGPTGQFEDGYYLSAVTGERVQRESFVGVVDDSTSHEDLAAMTDSPEGRGG